MTENINAPEAKKQQEMILIERKANN